MFLVNFGTVIALGLFAIYVLSISLLPALMTALPTKALPLKKSGAMNETKLTAGIGQMAENKPALVILVAVILSLPMAYGMSTLEVGFDTAINSTIRLKWFRFPHDCRRIPEQSNTIVSCS